MVNNFIRYCNGGRVRGWREVRERKERGERGMREEIRESEERNGGKKQEG